MKKILIAIISILWIIGCTDKQKPSTENQESTQNDSWWILWAADWQANNDKIAIGGAQDTLRFFSATTHELLNELPFEGTITKVKWHPTENLLAFSAQDQKTTASILNIDSNESIKLDSLSNEGTRAVGWSKNGELLAVGDYEGFITIFDKEGNFIKQIDTGQKSIIGLDWHPSENLIVGIGEKISLYNIDTDSLQNIKHREEEVLMLCVAWHPSGDFFVTGDYGINEQNYPPLLQYWSADGKKLKTIEESKAEYRNLTWTKDGTTLATASEKIRLWDENGNLLSEKSVENLLWGIDWNPDDTQLVTSDLKGKIVIWDKNLNKINELKY